MPQRQGEGAVGRLHHAARMCARARGRRTRGDQAGGGARLLQLGEILAVVEEGDVARPGLGQRLYVADQEVWIATFASRAPSLLAKACEAHGAARSKKPGCSMPTPVGKRRPRGLAGAA